MSTPVMNGSFAGGEVAPSLYGRTDISRYQISLRRCRNFICHPQGGVSNRAGTYLAAETKDSTKASRIMKFIFNDEQAYAIEVGDQYMRFFTDQEQVLAGDFTSWNAATAYVVGETVFEQSVAGDPSIIQSSGSSAGFIGTDPMGVTANVAQTFTLYTTTTINAASVYFLSRVGAPTGDITYRIETTSGAVPTGTLADANATGTVTVVDNADNVVTFTPFNLAAGTYALVLTCSVQAASNQFVAARSPTDTYSGGRFCYKIGDGLWVTLSSSDLRFEITTPTPSVTGIGYYRCIIANTGQKPSISPTYWGEQLVYEIATPYPEASLDKIKFESSADVIYITHPDFQTRTLSRYGNADWRLELYESENGPFMPMNLDESISMNVAAVTGATTLTAAAAYFDPAQVGALFKLRHYVAGQAVSVSFGSATTSAGIKCFTTWRIITHGTWTGTLKIEKSDDGGTTWTTLRTYTSVNDVNINTYGTEDIETYIEPFLIRLNMSDYTSGTCNADLTSDPFYQDGIVECTTYNSSITMNVAVLQDVASVATTLEWSEGSWSDYRGWPQVARFIQDRLAFASTYSEPMTTWMTEIGNYTSFLRHSTLIDSDGISVNLPARQLNAINGLVALRKLIALTSSSEWTIGPVSGAAFTPTTLEQLVQGYRGSSGIEPELIGNECIFCQSNSKVIRNLSYQFSADAFVGSDLNVLARHLFEGHNIIEMAYQQDPDSVLWCLRDDGILLGLTYMAEQEVIAWHWHDTDGLVESICCIPADGYDELWLIVNRDNGRYVEYMAPRMYSVAGVVDIAEQNFMDSSIKFAAGETISAPHLAGMTVNILEDGIPLGQETVNASGYVSLTLSAATVIVGLPYLAEIETLNVDTANKVGTIQGKKVKIANATFRVVDTIGGWIGPDSNNLYEAFPDAILAMNEDPAALFDGDIRMRLGAGYEDGGRVFFRQVDPLPVTINAIIPEVQVGDATS